MAQANLTFRPSGPLPWPDSAVTVGGGPRGRATGFLTAMRLAGPPPPEIGRRRQGYRPHQPSQARRRRPLTCRSACRQQRRSEQSVRQLRFSRSDERRYDEKEQHAEHGEPTQWSSRTPRLHGGRGLASHVQAP
jgi:hypothetical protein